jgi:hypothetical protein
VLPLVELLRSSSDVFLYIIKMQQALPACHSPKTETPFWKDPIDTPRPASSLHLFYTQKAFLYTAQSLYEAPLMQISGTPFLSLRYPECFLQLPSQIDKPEPTDERECHVMYEDILFFLLRNIFPVPTPWFLLSFHSFSPCLSKAAVLPQ